MQLIKMFINYICIVIFRLSFRNYIQLTPFCIIVFQDYDKCGAYIKPNFISPGQALSYLSSTILGLAEYFVMK